MKAEPPSEAQRALRAPSHCLCASCAHRRGLLGHLSKPGSPGGSPRPVGTPADRSLRRQVAGFKDEAGGVATHSLFQPAGRLLLLSLGFAVLCLFP